MRRHKASYIWPTNAGDLTTSQSCYCVTRTTTYALEKTTRRWISPGPSNNPSTLCPVANLTTAPAVCGRGGAQIVAVAIAEVFGCVIGVACWVLSRSSYVGLDHEMVTIYRCITATLGPFDPILDGRTLKGGCRSIGEILWGPAPRRRASHGISRRPQDHCNHAAPAKNTASSAMIAFRNHRQNRTRQLQGS